MTRNDREPQTQDGHDWQRRGFIWLGSAALAAFGVVAVLFFPGGPGHGQSPLAQEVKAKAETRSATVATEPAKAIAKTESGPPGPAPEGMVWIPGGTFIMGSDEAATPDALPLHKVTLDGFWMDRTEVTNRQFAKFVRETGYITVAEQKPDPKDFPGAPVELLVPGSLVFTPPAGQVSLDDHLAWWRYVPGANWKHPDGPESSIAGKDDHPVVQVCWDDAIAYARWAGKRLPSEAQWEYAARGGLERKRYCWGDQLRPEGRWLVNNWQGAFPTKNDTDDGFAKTAPAGSFPANGYGLLDMAGNVWEWCADWYRPGYNARQDENPRGPDTSFDPSEPGIPKRVQRGGSFLCSDLYCTRYLPGARGKGATDSGASHVGFRCILSPSRTPRPGT